MFRLEPTRAFEKSLKRLSKDEQRAVAKKLAILANDPFHSSLRTKKVQRLNGVFECSVNMDIRILWEYRDNKIILLINVGHHDIL